LTNSPTTSARFDTPTGSETISNASMATAGGDNPHATDHHTLGLSNPHNPTTINTHQASTTLTSPHGAGLAGAGASPMTTTAATTTTHTSFATGGGLPPHAYATLTGKNPTTTSTPYSGLGTGGGIGDRGVLGANAQDHSSLNSRSRLLGSKNGTGYIGHRTTGGRNSTTSGDVARRGGAFADNGLNQRGTPRGSSPGVHGLGGTGGVGSNGPDGSSGTSRGLNSSGGAGSSGAGSSQSGSQGRGFVPMMNQAQPGEDQGRKQKRRISNPVEREGNLRDLLGDPPVVIPKVIGGWIRDEDTN
ncbi:hypothetical protein NXT01_06890, partial [Corynebacterium sp. ES2775-CONJ]|nr:hypothetical protein [Corynebacterium sp. ES2775-CONJ]